MAKLHVRLNIHGGRLARIIPMKVDLKIKLHSGQSYACLYDDIDGGIFRNFGGPHPGLRRGGRDIVFWNFRHRSTVDDHSDFRNTEERRNHTFAKPTIAGFQAYQPITFENEGMNQLPVANVAPRSQFEAQLALRLKARPKSEALSNAAGE